MNVLQCYKIEPGKKLKKYRTVDTLESIENAVGGVPVNDLVASIVATQSGSGDPSPSNVRAISGYTGVNVTRAGVNSLNSAEAGTYTNNYVTATCDGHGKYTLSGTATGGSANITFTLKTPCKIAKGMYLHLFNTPYNVVSAITIQRSDNTPITSPTLSPANRIIDLSPYIGETIYSIRFYVANNGAVDIEAKPMICFSSTAIPFEEYTDSTTYSITWQTEAGTVYGGSIDLTTGVLTVTHTMCKLTGADITAVTTESGLQRARLTTSGELSSASHALMKCNMYKPQVAAGEGVITWISAGQKVIWIYDSRFTNLATAQSLLNSNHVILVYPLATPQTYQLTPTEVKTLLGVNNIFANTGNIAVDYRTKTASDIIHLVQDILG